MGGKWSLSNEKDGISLLRRLPDKGQTTKRAPRRSPRLLSQRLTISGLRGDGGQDTHTVVQGCNRDTGSLSEELDTPTEPSTTDKANQGEGQEAPWQSQVGWIYTGHGEWAAQENEELAKEHGNPLLTYPRWIRNSWEQNDSDIALHEAVLKGGYPNRWGARQEVMSTWNLNRFEELMEQYEDKEVVEWLRYGWPMGRLPTMKPPQLSTKNHKGATDFPEHLHKYINKEAKYGAVMGPFKKIPFSANVGISPLSSRPKKDSVDRRIILDLSFPIGQAVNDGIPKDTYLGFTAKLEFPRTDDFAIRIFHLGKGCMMFKSTSADISDRFHWTQQTTDLLVT